MKIAQGNRNYQAASHSVTFSKVTGFRISFSALSICVKGNYYTVLEITAGQR